MRYRRAISVVVYLAALAQTAIVSVLFFGSRIRGEGSIFSILRLTEWLMPLSGLFCLAAFLLPSSVPDSPDKERCPTFWLRIFSLLAFFLSPFISWVIKLEMYGIPMIPTKAHLYMQIMGLVALVSFLFTQVGYASSFSRLRNPRPNPFARLFLGLPLYLTIVPFFAVLAGAFYLSLFAEEGNSLKLIPSLLWVILEKGSTDRARGILSLLLGSVFFQFAAMLPYLLKHIIRENKDNIAIQNESLQNFSSSEAELPDNGEQAVVPEQISHEQCECQECTAESLEQDNDNDQENHTD